MQLIAGHLPIWDKDYFEINLGVWLYLKLYLIIPYRQNYVVL